MLESRFSKLLFFYGVALFQGLCITLLPASNFIYKSAATHAITDQQYGFIFLPMVIASILVNLKFRKILHRFQAVQTYYLGLLFHIPLILFWMALAWTSGNNALSFGLLIASDICLGIGFGILITVLNLCVVELYPEKRDIYLAGLHAVVGIGAALSPFIIQSCYDHGQWVWTGLVYLALAAVIFLISMTTGVIQMKLTEDPDAEAEKPLPPAQIPLQAKLLMLGVFFYGVIEATVGNWSTVYLLDTKEFSPQNTSMALSLFWLFITVGRILTTVYAMKADARKPYRLAPWIICLGVIALIFYRQESLTAPIFILIGLGCSCFFPLSVSFVTKTCDSLRDRLAAYTVAALMSGVGAGSFLTGQFRNMGWIDLNQAFAAVAGCAVIMICLLFFSMPYPSDSAKL